MSIMLVINNCWDCPYREDNEGGKVPHYCRKSHSCMCDEDFPKYCPLAQDNQICKTHCKVIIEDAKEIKALLDYDDDRMIELNYTRLMANIEQIKNSITEIELTYKKKNHSEWEVSYEEALKYQKLADEVMNNPK